VVDDIGGGLMRVVLLHPIGLRKAFWDDVVSELTPTFECVAINLPGHDDRPPLAATVTIDDLAVDVAGVLRSLDSTPTSLAGCSIGGMIAQGVYLAAPELVHGLVLSNTTAALPPAARDAAEKRAQAALTDMTALIEPMLERWFTQDYLQTHPAVVERVRGWLQSADPDIHASFWRAIAGLDYADRLRGAAVPVMVVAGSEDRSSSPGASAALAGLFADAEVHLLDGAGHLSPLEQPETFAKLVKVFAIRVEAAGSR
jgi:pimeloyl-ACP methyl ester carboxylesterase